MLRYNLLLQVDVLLTCIFSKSDYFIQHHKDVHVLTFSKGVHKGLFSCLKNVLLVTVIYFKKNSTLDHIAQRSIISPVCLNTHQKKSSKYHHFKAYMLMDI